MKIVNMSGRHEDKPARTGPAPIPPALKIGHSTAQRSSSPAAALAQEIYLHDFAQSADY
jgi:hypothetical protein